MTARKRKYTVSDAVRRANALKNLRHGRYWKLRPIPRVVARRRLEQFLPPEAIAVLDAYVSGEVEGVEAVKDQALVKVAVLRNLIASDVHERGPLIIEPQVGRSKGALKVYGERVLIHPGLRHLSVLDKQLGYSVEDQVAQRLRREEYKRERAELLRRNLRRAAIKTFASEHADRLPPAPSAPVENESEATEDE